MLKVFENELTQEYVDSLNNKWFNPNQVALASQIEGIKEEASKLRKSGMTVEVFEEAFGKAKAVTVSNKDVKAQIKIAEDGLGRPLTLKEKHNLRDSVRVQKMAELTSLPESELQALLRKEHALLGLGSNVEITMEPKPEDAPKSKKAANVVYIDRTGDPLKRVGYFQRVKLDSKGNAFVLITDTGKQLVGEILADAPTEYSYSMVPVARIKSLKIEINGQLVDIE